MLPRSWPWLGIRSILVLLILPALLPPFQAPMPARRPMAQTVVQGAPRAVPIVSADTASPIELVGSFGGAFSAIAISGTLAYVGEGAGLAVFDVSNPAQLVRLNRVLLPGATKVRIAGNFAYVIGGGQLSMLDLSAPANPVLQGRYEISFYASDIQIVGDLAYIAYADDTYYLSDQGVGGLEIVDLSDPAQPRQLGSYIGAGAARSLVVANGLAYIAMRHGLQIIDVNNPAQPTLRGTYWTGGNYGVSVAVVDDLAFLVTVYEAPPHTYAWDLTIVNVSNPANPYAKSMIGKLFSRGGAIQMQGNYLYFIGGACKATDYVCPAGLTIFDVSDPTKLTIVGSYPTEYAPIAIQVVAQRIYLLGVDWLEILDVNSLHTFTSYGRYVVPYPYVAAMKIVGNQAYVLGGSYQAYLQQSNQLQILNIDTPGNPILLGSYPVNGDAIDVVGQFAYIANGGLVILDISDPISPTLPGASLMGYPRIENPSRVQVIGQLAYLLTSGQLEIFDITDAAAPELRGSYDPANTSYYGGMDVERNLAYLTRGEAMYILDVTNPISPTVRSTYISSYPDIMYAIDVIGNQAYVAAGEYGPGVDLLDVGDPSRPTLQSRYRYTTRNSGVDVWPDGKLVYLADTGGIRILDATDPSHPRPRGSLDTIGQPTQLQVVGDLVYVADSAGGLLILRVHPERFPAPAFLPFMQS